MSDPVKWTKLPDTFDKVAAAVTALSAAATASKNDDAITKAKAVTAKFQTGYKKVFDSKGKTPAAKAEADKQAGPTLMSLYNAAVTALDAGGGPRTFNVRVKSQSSPKFMHNAVSAGKLPVWKYEYWDVAKPSEKKDFDVSMTVNMAGDENKQAKAITDAAVALIKSHHAGATVKVVQ